MAIRIPQKDPVAPTRPPKKEPFKAKGKPTLFGQLFPCSWRGVAFPITSMRVTLSQDLAEHKYWGKDAANVEATGRAPLQIEAEIPFVNGIVPGKNERWGVLYPTEFLKFLQAFNDKSTGLLDTPEIAGIACKPVSLEFAHEAQRRDGVTVTARWIETVDLKVESDIKLAPIDVAQLAALDLDAHLESDPTIPSPRDISFSELINDLRGVIDTSVSRLQILANKPNQILYRLSTLKDSIERGANVLTWPVTDGIERLQEAAHDIPKLPEKVTGALAPRRKTARYKTPSRMTVAMLAAATSNSVDDLLLLNPTLASRPAVATGVTVRYFV